MKLNLPYHHIPFPIFYRAHTGISVVFALLISLFSFSQQVSFNRVPPPPGKSFQHVTGMVQDKNGYLWLATKNGLFRYDGYQMKHYKNNPLDPHSISTLELEAIAIDSSGNIWIGTFNAGLEKLDPQTGIFTHYRRDPTKPGSLAGDTISAVLCDRDGFIWIGSNGLDRLDPKTNTLTNYRHDPDNAFSISDNEVRSIYEDRQGVLWIGTGSVYTSNLYDEAKGGLNKLDKATGRFTRYMHDPSDPSSLESNKVRALYEDSKGNFWVGTAGDGLHIMDRASGRFQHFHYDPKQPGKLSRPPLEKDNVFDHITFIHEDITGAIWIGTSESGLNYFNTRSQTITHYKSGEDSSGGFRDRTAWWAYTTRDGVLWISTLHGALYRINPRQLEIPFYQIAGSGTTNIYEYPKGNFWIGTRNDGLIQQDAKGNLIRKYLHNPADPTSISSNQISLITSDRNGTIWIGTLIEGLNRFDPKKAAFTRYKFNHDVETSLSNNGILTIYEGEGNDLWIGTFHGLNRFDKTTGQSKRFLFNPGAKEEEGSNVVTSVLKDKNANWWAGTWLRNGIKKFNPETGSFKTYLRGASILNILEDKFGVLWTAGNEGIYQYDPKLDTFYRFEDPIFLTDIIEVRALVEDNEGGLWAATTSGIVRINRQRNETTLFGQNYGINGNDFFFLAGFKDSTGKLFFGYQNGYYSFYPQDLTKGLQSPQLSISGFRISNILINPGDGGPLKVPLSETKTIHLNHNQNTFSFDFVGIDFNDAEKNHHLFMLENYDTEWNLAGSERKAIYFNVPPGKYVFKVKMLNSYGMWSERSIEIIISPPWWTTWWFRIGAILAIAAFFYLLVRWRIKEKFKRQIEQSEKERQLSELRRKTGELEMQALRAQMNPHFVFNSLNAINRFILQKDKTQASEYLTKFSRLVRMILQNSQSTLITLESEIDSLRLYLELEALRFDNRFEYNISVPRDLDIEMIKVPPLIIQPYAENAIWHGLMHKEENGHLYIDIIEEGQELLIRIKDDGIGRKQSSTMTSKTATKHKSMGLKITADRIAMLQKQQSQSSAVVINDLEHPDGTAAGTEVIIKIPVIYDKGDIGR